MEKEKQVQIPQTLFWELLMHFLVQKTDEHEEKIIQGLEVKLNAMVKHDLYTKSKTADTEEEREKARKEYLDKVGMHPDFRW